MTPWVGRWQTALGPLNYKQTNHQLQQTASYWISPPASQLQLMLLYSVMWESEESMCNHIHSVFGRRHRGQTWNWDDPLRADRSQIHLNHFFFFLSLFRLFNTAPIQNLSGLRSTEVTHFHSTRLLSQRECLTLEKKKKKKFLRSLIERMYIAQPFCSSTVAAACPHWLVIHRG